VDPEILVANDRLRGLPGNEQLAVRAIEKILPRLKPPAVMESDSAAAPKLQVNAQTYLYFAGNAARALERYSAALGAEVLFVMRYKDGPREFAPPGGSEQIYHATLGVGDTLINLSDDPRSERGTFGGFALLLHADSEAEADRLFARLSDQGTVQLAMMTVPWASRYGIVKDEFGIVWKIQAGGAANS